MTDKQPEALRLADALDDFWGQYGGPEEPHELNAAAELRRLHDQVESMKYELDAVAAIKEERNRLRTVNAELVGALQSCVDYLLGPQTRNLVSDEIEADKARAAIARATAPTVQHLPADDTEGGGV